MANSERLHNVTFTYFADAKQIDYTRKEFVYTNPDEILEEAKKDEEQDLKHKADKFAFI